MEGGLEGAWRGQRDRGRGAYPTITQAHKGRNRESTGDVMMQMRLALGPADVAAGAGAPACST